MRVRWTEEEIRLLLSYYKRMKSGEMHKGHPLVIEASKEIRDLSINREYSNNDPKFRNPSGNLNTIIEQLKNLCDYSIVSRFQDGNTYRINYLSSSTTSEFIKKLPDNETALGITHELKFYL